MEDKTVLGDSQTMHYWPEPLRDKAREDPFPVFFLISWLLPGLLLVVVLLIPYFWLRIQVAKNIVFLTDTGQLSVVRADREDTRLVGEEPLALSDEAQDRLEQTFSMLGMSKWSSDGRSLAATIEVNNNLKVAIFTPETGASHVISSMLADSNLLAMPTNGWAPTGTHLVLLEHDGARPFISLVSISHDVPVITPVVDLMLDTRAGFDWHPNGDKLLVTVRPEGIQASTLQIIHTSGETEPFIAPDGQTIHGDAVWSPDGTQIAYIATNDDNDDFLGGALWIVDSGAITATQLVSTGLNLAPFWNADDPNRIYFTRYLTQTNSFDLYQVSLLGAHPVERIGVSPLALVQHPYDRHRFIQWPTETRNFFTLTDEPLTSTSWRGFTLDAVIRARVQQSVPLMGVPQWSPDGRYIAATVWGNGQIQAALLVANAETPEFIPSSAGFMAVPTDGWSSSGTNLALIEHDGVRPLLTLFNTSESRPVLFDFTLDTRAGLDWHPTNESLLVTTYTEDKPNPILQVVDTTGQAHEFTPPDNQLLRANGAFSPDGNRIAYIAAQTYTTTQPILTGDLWIADSTGANPVQLTSDGQVIAPAWSPLGDYLFYIRFITQEGRFELYRLATNNSTPEEYIGPGGEAFLRYPFDRNLFLQWSPDGKQLLFVGDEPLRPIYYTAPNQDAFLQIHDAVPVVGAGRWSPDGRQFAGTMVENGTVRVALFKSPTGPPFLSPESSAVFAFPADGWSPDGAYLALVRHEGTKNQLSVFDTIQSGLTTASFTLDVRAGLSWHPDGSRLLITSLDKEMTPTLQIYNTADDTTHLFAPDDAQTLRADGAWSPDGNQVAYIARATLTDTTNLPPEIALAGSLWIADSNGRNPQQLVSEGYNLAPIWDFSHNRLLFTRYVTETATYDLYQVDLAGEKSERIGPSTPVFAQFPMDRSLFYKWSPDGRRWLLPGAELENAAAFYRIPSVDVPVQTVPNECESSSPSEIRWAPTNRALLVACSSGEMFLQWLDSSRSKTMFPNGLFPSWQP